MCVYSTLTERLRNVVIVPVIFLKDSQKNYSFIDFMLNIIKTLNTDIQVMLFFFLK